MRWGGRGVGSRAGGKIGGLRRSFWGGVGGGGGGGWWGGGGGGGGGFLLRVLADGV